MKYIYAAGAILSLATLSGCVSNNIDRRTLSKGAGLLLDTKIQSEYNLKKLIKNTAKAADNSDLQAVNHTNLSNSSDIVFGSGLVSSVAVLSDSGQWVSPGNFTDWGQLGIGLVGALFDTSMKKHPLTYSYFFNTAPNCNTLECNENAFVHYYQDVMNAYVNHLETNFSDKYVVDQVTYETSGLFADLAKARIKFKKPDELSRPNYVTMGVSSLGEVNGDLNIWGNEKPKDRPDTLGFFDLSYVDTSNLLIKISKKHPNILIFRGIDAERMKQGKPCYGGFFIQSGKPIVVDELNCVKLEG